MNELNIEEILNAFKIYDGIYKSTHVDAALKLQNEITPHLIGILEEVLSDPDSYKDDENYFAHIYAIVLLGHFMEQRAHRIIIELFSLPNRIPHDLFGDIVTELLPGLLFRTCHGTFDQIKSLIFNRDAGDFCRGSAMEAIVLAVADGKITRNEALEFFGSLFTGDEATAGSYFWSALANCICDLFPEELMPVIEKAYEDGLIYPGDISYNDFLKTLKQGKEKTLSQLKTTLKQASPEIVHDYLAWWACFKPSKPSESSRITPVALSIKAKKKPAKTKRKIQNRKKKKRKKKKNARKKR